MRGPRADAATRTRCPASIPATFRPIARYAGPLLHRPSEAVGAVTDGTRAPLADMLETMYDATGRGLAAVQTGVLLRLVLDRAAAA